MMTRGTVAGPIRTITKAGLPFLALSILTLASAYTQAHAGSSEPQLIGLAVFASDGIKIGQIVDFSMAKGQIDQIRVTTGSALGFGERIIAIPQPAFMIEGATVIIPGLSAEDVQALPNTPSESHGLRAKDR